MKKPRVLSVVGWLLVAAVALALWGRSEYKEKKEQEFLNDFAQSKLEQIRAVSQDTLEFALFNPVPVEGQLYALVTASLKDLYAEYGYSQVIVAEDKHYEAVYALRDSVVFLEGEYVGVPDTGGGNHLRFYDSDTVVGSLFLRANGQAELYCRLGDKEEVCHLLFSVDEAAANMLLAAIGRTY